MTVILQTKSTEIAFGEKVIVSIDFACEYCMVSMIRDLSKTKQYTCIDKKQQQKIHILFTIDNLRTVQSAVVC